MGRPKMQTKIAVVTSVGEVFFQLISELKRRRLPFLALKPNELIPLNVGVAITTESEKNNVHCPNILTYDGKTDPINVIDDALQIIRRKKQYDKVIVGIDPGKDFGIAVLGDGVILETLVLSNEENVAREIKKLIRRFQGVKQIIKIGNGARGHRNKLLPLLDQILPQNINLESVKENGTTKNLTVLSHQMHSKDVSSAIKISLRQGQKLARQKKGDRFLTKGALDQ
ncbi:MAG: hypothetical protein V1915_04550 [Candidatus Bathyarchaeota archaeon]